MSEDFHWIDEYIHDDGIFIDDAVDSLSTTLFGVMDHTERVHKDRACVQYQSEYPNTKCLTEWDEIEPSSHIYLENQTLQSVVDHQIPEGAAKSKDSSHPFSPVNLIILCPSEKFRTCT